MCSVASLQRALLKKTVPNVSEDFCVARYRHGEISGTTLAGLEFGQLEFVNEPNVSTPIQGSSSVVKDLHAYKASTICTCYNGGGDGRGGKVNKGGGGKVNKGGGGKVEVITGCAIM